MPIRLGIESFETVVCGATSPQLCEPESLDWELDEQSDESLDTDDDPSELNEPLMLGRLFDVLESLEPLLDDLLD